MSMQEELSLQVSGGGCRGYEDAMAIEAHSNDVCPTVKTLTGFTVIVEVDNDN